MSDPIWAWPIADWSAETIRFRSRPASLSSISPYTGHRSVIGPQLNVWVCEMTMPPVEGRAWRRRDAFFHRMGGAAGLIRIGDPVRTRPYRDEIVAASQEFFTDGTAFTDGTGWSSGLLPPSVLAGEIAVAGASTLLIAGLPASLAPCLYADDLFEIRPNGLPSPHGNLYVVVNDAPTDANGMTRVTIVPELRAGVAAGDMIVLLYPTSVFRPIDDEQGITQHIGADAARTGFTLVEELPS